MKCPKCSYVSHDYLDACRKCSTDLMAFKQKFNLVMMQPGDLDLSAAISENGGGLSDSGGFSVEAGFFDTQTMTKELQLSEDATEEFDIQLEDDPPGPMTREFPVIMQQDDEAEEEALQVVRAQEEDILDLSTSEEETVIPASSPAESSAEDAAHPPVNTIEIDMTDLADFDEAGPDELEESIIDLAVPDVDQEPAEELDSPSTLEFESPSESDALVEEPAEIPLVISEMSAPDEEIELTLSEVQDEPSVMPPPEVVPDLASDDLFETELVLELEEEEDESPPSQRRATDTEADVPIDVEDLDPGEDDKKL
jgi:hypothetical protein